jgi:hypothetical protein
MIRIQQSLSEQSIGFRVLILGFVCSGISPEQNMIVAILASYDKILTNVK